MLWLVPFVRAVWLLRQGSVALVTVVCWSWCRWWRSDGEGAGDAGWLRVVGFSPRHSWRRVLLVSLVVRLWWCCCGVLCCLGGGDPWLMLTMLRVMSMRWV